MAKAPKTTGEHIVSLYGHIKGLSREINTIKTNHLKHMHQDIDKIDSKLDKKFDNLITSIITPDKDIIPDAENLSPAFIVFDNYEIILKWNRSLRFSLAVCTLKEKFKNEL